MPPESHGGGAFADASPAPHNKRHIAKTHKRAAREPAMPTSGDIEKSLHAIPEVVPGRK